MSWFESLPPAQAAVPCGTGTHAVHWAAGRLTLPAHPDIEAELVLGALGGDKPACITLTETWAAHADDLAVLTVGPRCAADEVSVDWAETAALRTKLPALAKRIPAPPPPGTAAPGAGAAPVPGTLPTARAVSVSRITGTSGAAPGGFGAWAAYGTTGGPASGPGWRMEDVLRRQLALIELQELLALGPAFQFRLAGTVAAAWAAADRADERARRRPALSAALTGRFAPAAHEWLGVDPDAVSVTPHEGAGWGALELTGSGAARRLRAALPAGWLADVWACGLAVTSGHLVVAVDEPGYPVARVRALPAPDAEPVAGIVTAAGTGYAGLPAWTMAAG